MKVNTTLKKLYIGYNNIGDAGAKEIAEMLKKNRTLSLIDIHSNKIYDDGMKNIIDGIKGNFILKMLKMSGNPISVDVETAIRQTQTNKNKLSLTILCIKNLLTNFSIDDDADADMAKGAHIEIPAHVLPIDKQIKNILGFSEEYIFTIVWNNLHSIGYE